MSLQPAPRADGADLSALAARVITQARHADRFLLGIVGAPGSGKSTLAQALADEVGSDAIAVSMDGFHLAQQVIDRLGRASRKGAPDTFDAPGFVAAVRRLREGGTDPVYLPEFRREIEEPVAGAVAIESRHRVVIVEGNYLLLRRDEWARLGGLFHATWFIDPDEETRRERLLARHLFFGKSLEAARAATFGSDEHNARLIRSTMETADLVLVW